MTGPDTAALPDLPAGVWRHYKGPLYLVLGYAHDANAENLVYSSDQQASSVRVPPMGERTVVVYVGLELTDAHTGPRLAVRTAEDFHAWLHPDDWSVCPEVVPYGVGNAIECDCSHYEDFTPLVRRFTYVGPSWDGQRG